MMLIWVFKTANAPSLYIYIPSPHATFLCPSLAHSIMTSLTIWVDHRVAISRNLRVD